MSDQTHGSPSEFNADQTPADHSVESAAFDADGAPLESSPAEGSAPRENAEPASETVEQTAQQAAQQDWWRGAPLHRSEQPAPHQSAPHQSAPQLSVPQQPASAQQLSSGETAPISSQETQPLAAQLPESQVSSDPAPRGYPGFQTPTLPNSRPRYGQYAATEPTSDTASQASNQYQAAAPYGQQGSYSGTAFGSPTTSPTQPGTAQSGTTQPNAKKRFGTGVLVGGMVIAALIGAGASLGTAGVLNGNQAAGPVQQSQNAPVIVNNTDSVNAITAAAAKASPSVVTIDVTSGSSGGTGSGIILDNNGNILTNTHVVTLDGKAANPTVRVKLNDGRVFSAKVVGTDPLNDLAAIKIDAPNLKPAELGDSSKVNVGDIAIAIGAPLGLSGTVTDGIVSTANRTISIASSAVPQQSDSSQDNNGGNGGFNFAPPDGSSPNTNAQGSINIDVIQTDAAINPGNSGGALVNASGQVIGVNVAIASAGSNSSNSSSAGNIGVGFSIPINTAKRISQELISTGKASHGQLGVTTRSQAAGSGDQQSSSFSVGAVVANVTSGSAAEKAGIKVGDVITNVGTRVIDSSSSLSAAIREQAAGNTVKVSFLRGGKSQSVDVTLGAVAN